MSGGSNFDRDLFWQFVVKPTHITTKRQWQFFLMLNSLPKPSRRTLGRKKRRWFHRTSPVTKEMPGKITANFADADQVGLLRIAACTCTVLLYYMFCAVGRTRVEGYLVACMSYCIVDPTRLCDPCICTPPVDTRYVRSKALQSSFVCQGVKII